MAPISDRGGIIRYEPAAALAAGAVIAMVMADCRAPAASPGIGSPLTPAATVGTAAPPAASTRSPPAATPVTSAPSPALSGSTATATDVAACPEDMAQVAHDFCPTLQRHCLRSEYDKSNHITICHLFAPDRQRCLDPRVHLHFCIDRYEFPNREGAHPPVMIDWHDADRLCTEAGKRLCTEHEWTAACEGPEEQPFPYGHARDPARCNIDNPWLSPHLSRIYSQDPATRDAELARLDQSVPSGARPRCVSGFGVFDLTGNLDEWVSGDTTQPGRRPDRAALKGGAWGHVRNACRPVTASHAPNFSYYFVSTRCCRDPTPHAVN
ncbi:MAG: SUMF1/EgtB/PvdO family nonheme iron enzyme [Polyangiaceae bacterium]|nr:SUMF1/EgtB/PvdO family nonheme iron enzyme [Polyangiaceae bacterium]